MKNQNQIVRQIDRSLQSIIGDELTILKKVKRYIIYSRGKRIRSLLHYYIVNLLGYTGDLWRDVGAIGELIHGASLIHDDVLDNADFRRKEHTLNFLYGNKTSILAGDYLLACSLRHLNTLEISACLLPLFTHSLHMLSVGELLQMEQEQKFQISEKKYERIIWAKTAVLFGCMTEAAYLVAHQKNPDTKEQKRYREFGESLGRLFQIRDDFFDYFRSKAVTGKVAYQDFRSGLVTRPIIVLYKNLNLTNRRILMGLLKNVEIRNSEKGKDKLMELFVKCNLRQKLEREIEENVHKLMYFLRQHPESYYRDTLMKNMVQLFVTEVH